MYYADYLDTKRNKLNELEIKHKNNLNSYKVKLEEANDPDIEVKVSKRANRYKKQEERFLSKAEKRNIAVKKRVWEIDFFRATVVFFMLIDHFIMNFSGFFLSIFNRDAYLGISLFSKMCEFSSQHSVSMTRNIFRFVGIGILAILIGINTRFSRNNWKRFLQLFIFATIVNIFYAITYAFNILNYAIMNVIMSYALSMLLYCIVEVIFKRFKKAWPWICLGIAIAIFVSWGFIRYANLNPIQENRESPFWLVFNNSNYRVPAYPRDTKLNFIQFLRVVIGLNYFGAEWLGLFPMAGYVFLGAFIGQTLYKNKKSLLSIFDKENKVTLNEKFNRATAPYLVFGHHTLVFYATHQAIFTILVVLFAYIFYGLPLAIFS